MLLSESLSAALNAQVGHELGNSHQYIAIAAYFEGECLFGLAKIFYKQAEEEREHAMKFVKFVLDAGGQLAIPAVPAPSRFSWSPVGSRMSRPAAIAVGPGGENAVRPSGARGASWAGRSRPVHPISPNGADEEFA